VRRGKAKLRGIGRARKIIMLENYVIRGIPEFASGVKVKLPEGVGALRYVENA